MNDDNLVTIVRLTVSSLTFKVQTPPGTLYFQKILETLDNNTQIGMTAHDNALELINEIMKLLESGRNEIAVRFI